MGEALMSTAFRSDAQQAAPNLHKHLAAVEREFISILMTWGAAITSRECAANAEWGRLHRQDEALVGRSSFASGQVPLSPCPLPILVHLMLYFIILFYYFIFATAWCWDFIPASSGF